MITIRHTSTAFIAAGLVVAGAGSAAAQTTVYKFERLSPRVRDAFVQRYQQARLGPEQTEKFAKTIKAGRGVTLDLQNISGGISVSGASGDEIVIDAVKRVRARDESRAKALLAAIDIQIEERPGRVTIRTLYPRMTGNVSAAVDYSVRVPQDASMDLTSITGDLRVINVKGDLRLETVSGSVHAGQAPKLEYAKSASGNVEITGTIDGELSASSLSGVVMLKDVKARALELMTVTGDMVLDGVLVDRIRARSTSGDVRFLGPLSKNGRYDMNSHSGRIHLLVPATAGFEVDASTFSGNLRFDIPLKITATRSRDERGRVVPEPPAPPTPPRTSGSARDREIERARERARAALRTLPKTQTLRGIAGDASAFLLIRTFSGDVSIEKTEPTKKQ